MSSSRHAALALALASILALGSERALAGTPSSTRLDGEFYFEDGDEQDVGGTLIEIDGSSFSIEGSVYGLGTGGDVVQIFFLTPLPTKANADAIQGRVRQSAFGRLVFVIDSDVPERELQLSVFPEKCSIDGKVDLRKEEGQIAVDCSATNIYADISSSQEASIQAAFQTSAKVKIKVDSDGSKGSLRIRMKGPFEEPPDE